MKAGQGDSAENLARLLREEEAFVDAGMLRAMLPGVAAAPRRGGDPDAWMRLVGETVSPRLAAVLRDLLDEAATADGGLTAGKAATRERLTALRAELDRRGLDGFVVPRADAHQGEFVPPHAQRLTWLTGFNGSAGLAVALRDAAAIFVDGRYTLQAREEVDTTLFTPRHLSDEPPSDWIAQSLGEGNFGDGGRLGYDPWLHTPDGVQRLAAAVERAGGRLIPVEENPIDAVWSDRPEPPLSPAEAHPLAFAGEAAAEKRARIGAALREQGAEAAVLTLPDSIAWLLNVRGGDILHTPVVLSFALIQADGAVSWFVDRRKLVPGLAEHLGKAVQVRPLDELGAELDALAAAEKPVLADPASAPAWVFDRLSNAGRAALRGGEPVQAAKARKNATELAGSRAAHRRDGAAVTRFLAWLAEQAPRRAGGDAPVTEIEAAEVLAELRAEQEHFRDLSFETISGAGPHGAIVHYRVSAESNRALGEGELYLVDSGGQYLDGTTDITRTLAIGAPSDEMRARYTRVLRGHIALATARFPAGTTGSHLDAVARLPLWQAGLDFDHGTGHGVGSYLGVHEGPQRISKLLNRVALEPGMICSNEPGYYKADAYGIRIETLVAVEEHPAAGEDERAMRGFETLTVAPYCRALIETSMLNPDELRWLNAYHAWVLESLSPLLDAASRAWLEAETAAL